MRLKQWLIKQFGSKEFVESRMVSTCVPQEPVEDMLPKVKVYPPMPEPKAPDSSSPYQETVLHFEPKQEPVVGELAQQLAEAIRTGKITLEIEEQLLSSIRYKEINGVAFVRNVTGIDCNGAFNSSEQRYLLAAHKDWQEDQERCKRTETENKIRNLLSSIDK